MSDIYNHVIFYTTQEIYNRFTDIFIYLGINSTHECKRLDYLAIQHNKRKSNELMFFDIDTISNTIMSEYLPKQKYIILINKINLDVNDIKDSLLFDVIKNAYTIWYYNDCDKNNKNNKNIISDLFTHTKHYQIQNAPAYKRVNKTIDILVLCELSKRNYEIIASLGQFFNIRWCTNDQVLDYLEYSKIVLYLFSPSDKRPPFYLNNILSKNKCFVIKEDNSNNFPNYYSFLQKHYSFVKHSLVDHNNNEYMIKFIQYIYSITLKFTNISNLLNLEVFQETFHLPSKYNAVKMHNFANDYQYTDCVEFLKDFDKNANNATYYSYYESYRQYMKENKSKIHLKNNNTNSTVFVAIEHFPHMEMILYNVIMMFYKQGYHWNHTVICGRHNIKYIQVICDKLKSCFENINVKIIQLDTFETKLSSINDIFYQKEIWKSMPGEILFLYTSKFNNWDLQLESIIDINFVSDKNVLEPTFSLRKMSHMIDIIDKYPIDTVEFDYNTILPFMAKHKMTFPPETSFFSNIYLQNQYGRIRFKN